MKKLFLSLTLFLSVFAINAQTGKEVELGPDYSNTEEVFTIVEKMPEFPGRDTALNEFFVKNLQYPVFAKEQGIQGKVWISFVVDKDGTIGSIEVRRAIGGGCDEEAVRVIKLMPKWIPGSQGGKPLKVKFTLPVRFTLK